MESKHKNALIGALLAVVFVMAVGYAAFAQQLTINGTAEITSNWDVHFDIANDAQKTPVCASPFNSSSSTTCSTDEQYTAAHPTGNTDPVALTHPYGKIVYSNSSTEPLNADILVELVQPSDSVTFTLKPKNFGTGLNAAGTMTVGEYTGSATPQNSGANWGIETDTTFDVSHSVTSSISQPNATTGVVTVVKGYIKFTITPSHGESNGLDDSLAPGESDTITVKAEYVSPAENARDIKPTSAGITIGIHYVQV